MHRIDLGDYLAIAERITGIPPHVLRQMRGVESRIESALAAPFIGFGDVDVYQGIPMKAAVLCSRLIRNHPLPDGNKRAAYLSMREFLFRNGTVWMPAADSGERGDVVWELARGAISEEEFSRWVARQIAEGPAGG